MELQITKLFLVTMFTSSTISNHFNKSFNQKQNSVYSVTLNKMEYKKTYQILKENFADFPSNEENGKINYTELEKNYFLKITLKKKKLKIEFICKNEATGNAIAIAYSDKMKGLKIKVEEIKTKIEELNASLK